MNAQFHTPSFGDELVYDLHEVETNGSAGGVSNTADICATYIQPQQHHQQFQQQQQQLQSKRMRSMDQSLDEYHSANDDSFSTGNIISSPALSVNNTVAGMVPATTTMAARKQLLNEPAKPLSAYGLFFRDTVSAIKQQNPNCSFQELSRIVASMWEALDVSHKTVYQKKHELATEEYIKQMRIYRQQVEQQQQQQLQEAPNTCEMSPYLQTKPAVFTIHPLNQGISTGVPQQPQSQSPSQMANNTPEQQNNGATPSTVLNTPSDPPPAQMQMLSEAGAVQKCTRENCNKRAIINPDWEDEYCSNECVVIHCRNVFNAWVQSNLESRKQ